MPLAGWGHGHRHWTLPHRRPLRPRSDVLSGAAALRVPALALGLCALAHLPTNSKRASCFPRSGLPPPSCSRAETLPKAPPVQRKAPHQRRARSSSSPEDASFKTPPAPVWVPAEESRWPVPGAGSTAQEKEAWARSPGHLSAGGGSLWSKWRPAPFCPAQRQPCFMKSLRFSTRDKGSLQIA